MEKHHKKIQEMTKSQAENFLRSTGFLIPITPEQVAAFEELYPVEDLPDALYEPMEYPGTDNPFVHMMSQQQTTVAMAARKGNKKLSEDTLRKLEEGLLKAKAQKKKN